MDTQPAFGFKDLFASLVGDMVKAVSERGGENKERQFARSQAAAHTIMGFQPRDSTEAMIAGHCLMFHEMMVDSVRETVAGSRSRPCVASRGKAFSPWTRLSPILPLLERYRARPSQGRRDEPAAVADPIVQPVARTEPPAEIRDAADSTKQADPAMTQQATDRTRAGTSASRRHHVEFQSVAGVDRGLQRTRRQWPLSMPAIPKVSPAHWASTRRARRIWRRPEVPTACSRGELRRVRKSPRLSGGAPGAEMATPSRYPNGSRGGNDQPGGTRRSLPRPPRMVRTARTRRLEVDAAPSNARSRDDRGTMLIFVYALK